MPAPRCVRRIWGHGQGGWVFRELIDGLDGKQTLLLGQLLRFDPAVVTLVDEIGSRVGIAYYGDHVSELQALTPAAWNGAANLDRNNHQTCGTAVSPRPSHCSLATGIGVCRWGRAYLWGASAAPPFQLPRSARRCAHMLIALGQYLTSIVGSLMPLSLSPFGGRGDDENR